jgi:hypothetical protein
LLSVEAVITEFCVVPFTKMCSTIPSGGVKTMICSKKTEATPTMISSRCPKITASCPLLEDSKCTSKDTTMCGIPTRSSSSPNVSRKLVENAERFQTLN